VGLGRLAIVSKNAQLIGALDTWPSTADESSHRHVSSLLAATRLVSTLR
jgi:hypothetical protein